jgi:hypothetical protein
MRVAVIVMKIINAIAPCIAPFIPAKNILHDLHRFVFEFRQFKTVPVNKHRQRAVRKIFIAFAAVRIDMYVCQHTLLFALHISNDSGGINKIPLVIGDFKG